MMGRLFGLLFSVSGCSLIYNPGDLPDKGPMLDAAIADADPAMLRITAVRSPPLLEGAGQDGSSPAVLVLYGNHITQGAEIEITSTNPSVVVADSDVAVAQDGNSIAALVTAAYMDTVGEAAGDIPLTVTVTEPGAPPATIGWTLKPLDELTTAGAQPAPAAGKTFSRVAVTGDLTFPVGPNRVVLRAVGKIAISGAVRANANGQNAGAGGCNGGGVNAKGACFGGGSDGGGGGGFAEKGEDGAVATGGAMSGDPLLRAYDGGGMEVNRGGGGGGGAAVGGGGGGAIEITAGGALSVGTIEANAAAGDAATVGRSGGGGAGGAVVLRSGATLTLPSNVSVAAGAGGSSLTSPGGKGSIGRWRFDANDVSGTPSANPAPKRGPMLAKPASPIFDIKRPQLTVNADPAGSGASVSLVVQFPDGTTDTKNVNLTGPMSTVIPELAIGHNVVCVVVAGGNFASPEARNCVDVAFVP